MPHAPLAALVAVAAAVLLPLAQPQDPGQPRPVDLTPGQVDPKLLQRMAWLCGTWVRQEGGKTTEEHWRPVQGSTILGSSHTYDATRTHFFEHLRIMASRGGIAYVALPSGTKATAFLLTKLEDGVLEFENPDHDHPQRIRYEKTTTGMAATISQLDGSKLQRWAFVRHDKQ
jgi:hypothetical protein